jgi:sugar-specific transcriptional regulator TrmB
MSETTANAIPADGNNAASSLQELGFSEYEAKAYLALLRQSPANAYEVAKASGIPSSKIYQVLARMVERRTVLAVEEAPRNPSAAAQTAKTSYVPLPPQELIAAQRQRHASRLDQLERQLANQQRPAELSYIWNFSDYPSLQEQLGRLIQDTRRELILSMWREDASILIPVLTGLSRRGVKAAMVLYGVDNDGPGGAPMAIPPQFEHLARDIRIYPHPIADTLYHERGGRGLSAIADGCRALTATIFDDGTVEGAWSLNRGFALLAEDYIKHDIYLMKIVARMDSALVQRFGERYHLLRDIYADEGRCE